MTKQTGQQTGLVGRVLHNTYRIGRLIGEGGMGVVYEASHLRLARRFAVKMLSGEVAEHPEDLARFKREALITSALGHPHILEVIDFNQTDEGMPYLVMELLDGEDLARRLERVGRLPLGQVASIFQQAAAALEAVHDKGIIHRDLKPHNIFLCRRGKRDDFVKIVDFGISTVLGLRSLTTEAHGLPGTPNYMSPEQVKQKAAKMGVRSDVFSMGAILYAMLSGEPPFYSDTVPGVLFKIVFEEPPPLQTRNPDLPDSIAAAISKAMRKSPEERFGSMRAFWKELESALERAGVAYPEPPVDPRTIWAREDPDRKLPPDELLTAPESSADTGLAGVTHRLPTSPSEEVIRATAPVRWKRILGWAGAVAAALVLGVLAIKVARDSRRPPAAKLATGRKAAPPSGGDLLVLIVQPVGTLDPVQAHTHEEANVITQTHEGLVRYDAARGVVEPSLATSWRGRGTTTSFELRQGVRFHDGAPLSAAAVARSLRRSLRPRLGRSLLWDVDEITTPGPMTVAIRLSRPSASLLARLTTYASFVSAPASPFPLGTGPYRAVAWNHQVGSVTLAPNPHYWGGAPRLHSITFRSEADAEARASPMIQGDAQIVMALPHSVAHKLERHRDISLLRSAQFMSVYLSFNTEKPYLKDPAVRWALSMALDREQLVKELYQDSATVATNSVPPTLRRSRQAGSFARFDPAEARRALAKTPVAAQTLRLYLWRDARPYMPDPALAGRLLVTSFQAAGIKVAPVFVTFDELNDRICKRGLHDMVVFGYSPAYPDPENIYWLLSREGMSCARFADRAFQELFDRASAEQDIAKRDSLFAQLESLVALKRPWLPLAHVADHIAIRSEVRGYQYGFSFINLLWLKNAFLQR